jgi:hypothetical protein
MQEAIAWTAANVDRNTAFTGEISQYNASASFALIRFATKIGPDYWLKAAGAPNRHEFQITKKLAELCPEFLPRQIAAREDWNAWLMEDAGRPLDSWALSALEQAVLSMAQLQKKTVGRTGEFLAAGATDQRVSTLRANLPELLEYLNEIMAKQTSIKAPRIDAHRLRQIVGLLSGALIRMEDLGIPETLVHNDMNTENVLFRETKCVFTDWCEVSIGNPFFVFQHLCLLQPHGRAIWNPRLRDLYKRSWAELIDTSVIEKAFALMPVLAILSYLYGRGAWLHSLRRNDPHVQSYVRSLARHLDSAAQEPELLEVLCQ